MNRLFENLFEQPALMRVVAVVVALVLYFINLPGYDKLATFSVSRVPVTVSQVAPGLTAASVPGRVTVKLRTTQSLQTAVKRFPFRADVSAVGTGPGVVSRRVTVSVPGATEVVHVTPALVKVHISRKSRRMKP